MATRKRGGWSNPASAVNGQEGGRPPIRAIVREGDGVFVSHVFADGMSDLGRGKARIERIGRGRLITLPQEDGSEIRILIVK